MTKSELIDIVAESQEGLTKAQIGEIYESIFDNIVRAVKEDAKHRFQIKDFGTFELNEKAARKGRNPKTGEEIEIAAKTTLKFRPAKSLEEKLSK